MAKRNKGEQHGPNHSPVDGEDEESYVGAYAAGYHAHFAEPLDRRDAYERDLYYEDQELRIAWGEGWNAARLHRALGIDQQDIVQSGCFYTPPIIRAAEQLRARADRIEATVTPAALRTILELVCCLIAPQHGCSYGRFVKLLRQRVPGLERMTHDEIYPLLFNVLADTSPLVDTDEPLPVYDVEAAAQLTLAQRTAAQQPRPFVQYVRRLADLMRERQQAGDELSQEREAEVGAELDVLWDRLSDEERDLTERIFSDAARVVRSTLRLSEEGSQT